MSRRVRRRDDGPKNYYNHQRGIRITEAEPEVVVSADDAAYLVEEHGGFAYVDEDAADDGDWTDTADGSPDLTAETLADEHWQRAVSAVEAGEADGFLDALAAIDDRNSVQSAIAERRAELEE